MGTGAQVAPQIDKSVPEIGPGALAPVRLLLDVPHGGG